MLPPILFCLVTRGSSGRDNPDHRLRLSDAMTYDQETQFETHTEHDKPIFPLGVVRIEELDRVLIVKHRLRFFERDSVLPSIERGLFPIPLEADVIYMYNVNIPFLLVVFKKLLKKVG